MGDIDQQEINFRNYIILLPNQHFFHQSQLKTIYAIMMLLDPSRFDHLRLRDSKSIFLFQELLQIQNKEIVQSLKVVLDNYIKKFKQSGLGVMERFVSILKSKRIRVSIYNNSLCSCCKTQEIQTPSQIHNTMQAKTFQLMKIMYLATKSPSMMVNIGKIVAYSFQNMQITLKDQNYYVVLKSLGTKPQANSQFLSRHLFGYGILLYLLPEQIYTCRGVCKQWMQCVKMIWNQVFKRQMYKQMMANELMKDLQYQNKLIQIRTPMYHKIKHIIASLLQALNWKVISDAISDMICSNRQRKILVYFLAILRIVPLEKLNFQTDQIFQQFIDHASQINSLLIQELDNISCSLSYNELIIIKQRFVDSSLMTLDHMTDCQKNWFILALLLKLFTFFSILRIRLLIGYQRISFIKQRLITLNKTGAVFNRKKFLQQAYHNVLYRDLLKDKVVVGKDIQIYFSNFLKAIFCSALKDSQQPDYVLEIDGRQIQIKIDQITKLDMLLIAHQRIKSESQIKIKTVDDVQQQLSHSEVQIHKSSQIDDEQEQINNISD